MQRSFLCFVSKQQAEGSQVAEMKHLFICNLVALVLGNKAKEVALQSMCLSLGSECHWQGTEVASQLGSPRLLSEHALVLPMAIISVCSLSVSVASSRKLYSSLLVLLNLRFVSALHTVCSYAKIMCWCNTFLPDLPLLNLANMFCLTLKFNAQPFLPFLNNCLDSEQRLQPYPYHSFARNFSEFFSYLPLPVCVPVILMCLFPGGASQVLKVLLFSNDQNAQFLDPWERVTKFGRAEHERLWRIVFEGWFVLGWRNTLYFEKLFQLYSPTQPKKGYMLDVNNSLELQKK